MDGKRQNVPTFRRLKGIKDRLERDIYNRSELLDGPFLRDAQDRWQQANAYHAENERDQETVDEIDFVLDYFRQSASPWTVRAYFVFVALAAVVMVLAAFAFTRTF